MAQHTPQWRVDIRMMLETLKMAKVYIEAASEGNSEEWAEDVLRAIELAIKLGEQYRKF